MIKIETSDLLILQSLWRHLTANSYRGDEIVFIRGQTDPIQAKAITVLLIVIVWLIYR